MNFPKNLLYSKTHEWVLFAEDGTATVGITDYAQDQLGDLVFVNLPEAGDTVTAGETFADVESVKAVSDVNSPVTGEVAEVNEGLADEPQRMNEDPYGSWFVRVKEITDREDLMAVWESARNLPPDEVFNQTRYVLADINGDGEGELLTGDAEGRITNLYTQQGGRPRHVKSGFVRDACYYLGGNRFLSTGSTGGRNMVLSLWHLDKQGSPVCDQYYYTREAEADPARQEVYVGTDPNTDGEEEKKSTYTVGELKAI